MTAKFHRVGSVKYETSRFEGTVIANHVSYSLPTFSEIRVFYYSQNIDKGRLLWRIYKNRSVLDTCYDSGAGMHFDTFSLYFTTLRADISASVNPRGLKSTLF